MTVLPATVVAALRLGRARLQEHAIPHPRLEAELLLRHLLSISREALLVAPDRPLPPETARAYLALLERRAAHEPLAYITGHREFYGHDFLVGPGSLIPRPDSETLVDAVLDQVVDRTAPLRLLDLGTGSGCLLLSLLKALPKSSGVGIDISHDALAIAGANARALGLQTRTTLLEGDWFGALEPDDRFDIIVSNPPYIREEDIAALMPEVSLHEPPLALSGGKDGLDAYRMLAPNLSRHLSPGGVTALEVGAGQARAVEALLTLAGLDILAARSDLGGHERVVPARKSEKSDSTKNS